LTNRRKTPKLPDVERRDNPHLTLDLSGCPAEKLGDVALIFNLLETLPAEQYVDLQLSKERPDYTLHLLYNGGKGQTFVQNILMKATLSNGQVVEQYMNDGKRRPRQGDEIVIKGTRGSDRVEVFVTSAGRTYKVLDQPMLTHTL